MHVQKSNISVGPYNIATLVLNRPEKANAFSGELIAEMQSHLDDLAKDSSCRAAILTARGKHFSAGADLEWMKQSAQMTLAENVEDAQKLLYMLQSLSQLPFPTIALTHGAAYGGAIGLLAACDVVIAEDHSRFCLSELRLGLLPAMIYPFLLRKMRRQPLRRLSLSAKVFHASEALSVDLIDEVVTPDQRQHTIQTYLDHFLACAPQATKDLKDLDEFFTKHAKQTTNFIAQARTRPEGQHGLQSFFNKEKAQWAYTLPHEDSPLTAFFSNTFDQ
ncbi:MAG: enoyl-CoA hydratase-related protein [Oligoflexales bacterium]